MSPAITNTAIGGTAIAGVRMRLRKSVRQCIEANVSTSMRQPIW